MSFKKITFLLIKLVLLSSVLGKYSGKLIYDIVIAGSGTVEMQYMDKTQFQIKITVRFFI